MTSQNLVSSSSPHLPGAQTSSTSSEADNLSTSASEAPTARSKKLPYGANHQVELLHLHAEVEALLQQLKQSDNVLLKQVKA